MDETNTHSSPSAVLSFNIQARLKDFYLSASAEIKHSGITGIMGPSGCGKTTLLRCISGLQNFDGFCRINDELIDGNGTHIPVQQRDIAYVFQDACLFPHMSVLENIQFAWKRTRKESRRFEYNEIIKHLKIETLLSHHVSTLSGGQRQRVALARAIASQPKLMLLDEPISALDSQSKREVMQLLRDINKRFNLPILYVSHSLGEHAQLSDHMILMGLNHQESEIKGSIFAQGQSQELFSRSDIASNHADEAGCIADGIVAKIDEPWDLILVRLNGFELWLKRQNEHIGDTLRIRLLAKDLSLSLQPNRNQSVQNVLSGIVIEIAEDYHPANKLVVLKLGETKTLARVTAKAIADLKITEGQSLWVQVKSAAVIG